jgi:predicted porin
MKKGLLTTSALVAAGMIGMASQADAQGMRKPNPVQLKVGGYMEQFVGYAFRDATFQIGPSGQFDQQTEAEIHFTGQAKLDNGLQIRAHVEYEVTGSPGNVIDEQTLTLRNGFGQVILGNEDPVASLMTTGYITTFVTNAGGSLTYDITPWIPLPANFTQGSPVAGALTDPKLESFDSDASKIIYVSPRIGGFQVGVNYAPESSQQLQNGAGANSGRGLPLHVAVAGDGSGWHNEWGFGANYTTKIDQVGIGVAAGYVTAKHRSLDVAGVPAGNATDPGQFGAGFRIDYGAYRFVFGYKRVWNMDRGNGGYGSGPFPTTYSKDGQLFNVGGIYRWGPNAVSLTYQNGREKGSRLAGTGDNVANMAMLAYGRTLAPGIEARAYLAFADYNGENLVAGTDGAGSLTPGSFTGGALITSIRLDF